MDTNQYCSEEGVFLNSKGEVVYGKDPDRKTQLVAPGGCIPLDKAKALGINTEPTPQPEQKAVTTAPANKALEMPKDKK